MVYEINTLCVCCILSLETLKDFLYKLVGVAFSFYVILAYGRLNALLSDSRVGRTCIPVLDELPRLMALKTIYMLLTNKFLSSSLTKSLKLKSCL